MNYLLRPELVAWVRSSDPAVALNGVDAEKLFWHKLRLWAWPWKLLVMLSQIQAVHLDLLSQLVQWAKKGLSDQAVKEAMDLLWDHLQDMPGVRRRSTSRRLGRKSMLLFSRAGRNTQQGNFSPSLHCIGTDLTLGAGRQGVCGVRLWCGFLPNMPTRKRSSQLTSVVLKVHVTLQTA